VKDINPPAGDPELFAPAPENLDRYPTPEGLLCPKCGKSAFRTFWQTFADGNKHVRCNCAKCGAFVRYLPKPGGPECRYEPRKPNAHAAEMAPPPEGWVWIGMIRQSDKQWHAVAMAPTLDRTWDALLHYPGTGDYLCFPSKPVDEVSRAASPEK
jgi:hypothetical protein